MGTTALLGGRFLALLLVASKLEPYEFGSFAVVQSLVAFIERLFNMQSWQFVVQRGSGSLDGSGAELKHIIGAALIADLLGATAAFLMGVLVIGVANERLGLASSVIPAAQAYCLVVFLNPHGTWAGLLRLHERFALYSIYQMVAGIGVLVSLALVFAGGPQVDCAVLLFVWLTVEFCAFALLLVGAFRTAADRGVEFLAVVRSLRTASVCFRASLPFFLSVNGASSLRMVTKEGDVLIVGALSGPVLAGAYKLARNLAMLPVLFTDMLYYVAYPLYSKLAAVKDRVALRYWVRRALFVGGAIGAAAILIEYALADYLLSMLSWPRQPTLGVIKVYAFAAAGAAATFPFAPLLLALGEQRYQLKCLAVATAIYLLAAVPLTLISGPMGAAWAAVLFIVVWSLAVARRLQTRGVL
jgi:O-antigen/teichoic acid export membrane protein